MGFSFINTNDPTRMNRILISFFLCLALMYGCSKTETPSPGDNKGTGENTLIIGLIPERNIFDQIDMYEPLANYISDKAGVKIKLHVLTSYGNIIDNFNSLHLDGAFFGSFTYALAHMKLGVEPVARPVDLNDSSTYYGLIFARKDSGIKTAKNMKGKTFSFVDRLTTAGYLLPLSYFRENGISDYRTYFKETYFTGTHEDTIYDVLNRKADIGASKNTVFYKLAASDKRIMEELVILKRSPDVPQNALALRKGLDSLIRKKLTEALLNMHNDETGRKVLEKFGAKKFILTIDADYGLVYEYIKKVNIDIPAGSKKQ